MGYGPGEKRGGVQESYVSFRDHLLLDRRPRRITEILSKPASIGLGKPKSTWR